MTGWPNKDRALRQLYISLLTFRIPLFYHFTQNSRTRLKFRDPQLLVLFHHTLYLVLSLTGGNSSRFGPCAFAHRQDDQSHSDRDIDPSMLCGFRAIFA